MGSSVLLWPQRGTVKAPEATEGTTSIMFSLKEALFRSKKAEFPRIVRLNLGIRGPTFLRASTGLNKL